MRSIWELGIKDLVSPGVAKMQSTVQRAFAQMGLAENQLQTSVNRTTSSFEKQDSVLRGLRNTALGFLTVASITAFGNQVYTTGTQLETFNNVINYTSGSAIEAAKNHEFLKHIVKDYKLPLMETTDGFAQFNAALMGSKLQGEAARRVFEGVSVASTAMHLSAAQSSQVFLALNQMVSKGTVQAQEMKLQLGNALPGAFQLAAQAMGVTTKKFGEMMEAGEVVATDFLPKFAAALQEKFQGAIPTAIQSTTARMTDLKNQFAMKMDEMFIKLQPFINKIIDLGIVVMPMIEKAFNAVYGVASTLFNFFSEHQLLLYTIGTAAIFLATWMGIVAAATWAATAAMTALNFVFAISPLGWVAIAIGAITGAVIYFWNTSEKFRLFLYKLWGSVKEVFSNIGTIIWDALKGSAQLILGIFTLNIGMIKAGLADLKNAGGLAVGSVQKGWAQGGIEGAIAEEGRSQGTSPAATSKGYNSSVPFAGSPTGGAAAGNSGSAASGGGGGGGRNVNIVIRQLVGEVKIYSTVRESVADIKNQVAEALIGAVNNTELAIQ